MQISPRILYSEESLRVLSIGGKISPDQAMVLAVETAKQGIGFVSPNPVVGCVVVDKDHRLISSGAHLQYGEAHAEINAIDNVQDSSQFDGASIYVTLEPCAHQGKTGSCATRISQLPIKKVIYGAKDPNPKVSGKGLDILTTAGIEVELFDKWQSYCLELAEQFHYHIKRQRPFISIKIASSLDGKIALHNGDSQWITGTEARRFARQLRGHYDGTMVGAGTIIHDDPHLDFRETIFDKQKNNKIVIVDPKAVIDEEIANKKVFKIHGPQNIFLLQPNSTESSLKKILPNIIKWSPSEESWQKALLELHSQGLYSLFCEGGSFVHSQLLQYGLAQKFYLFQSNLILGKGLGWADQLELSQIMDSPKLKNVRSRTFGEDRLLEGYF